MTSSSCNTNCCTQATYPALPEVTVTQNIVNFGDQAGILRQQIIPMTDVVEGTDIITLDYTPILHSSVMLFSNGVHMSQGVNYSIEQRWIQLLGEYKRNSPNNDNWIFTVQYWTTEDVTTPSTNEVMNPVGAWVIYPDGVSIPAGYLEADGSAVSQTAYSLYFEKVGHLYRNDAADEAALELLGQFRMPDKDDVIYNGAVLQYARIIVRVK